MDKIKWLADKLPSPTVIHDRADVVYYNTPFVQLTKNTVSAENLNFVGWLSDVILSEPDAAKIEKHICDKQELRLETEGSINGVSFHWLIQSFCIPEDILPKHYQITMLFDNSNDYLNRSYWELHSRVSKATMQLMKEVSERKIAEEKALTLNKELQAIQQKLVYASRQAGMAEIAASVLHNIGNVLNSAGISIDQLKEKLSEVLYQKVDKIADFIKAHASNLPDYMQNDDRGKLLPEYLPVLFHQIQENKSKMLEDIQRLITQHSMMKEILAAQAGLSKSISFQESVSLPNLLDTSLNIVLPEKIQTNKQITISKNYNYYKLIDTDKVLMMQVLVNLLKNAKEAVLASESKLREIEISVNHDDKKNEVSVSIEDTGIGIEADQLEKIFEFGYTNKKSGHGFGLHNCALIVKQLGGKLIVESQGKEKGAIFTLTLPSVTQDR